MMPNVKEFFEFYHSSLGHIISTDIHALVNFFWPSLRKKDIAALGFPFPILGSFYNEECQIIAVTPAQIGGMAWPDKENVLSIIAHEEALPFLDNTFDHILMLHSLEYAENPNIFLNEVWRILKPEGTLLVLTTNRRGLWSHYDNSPFGHGRPFTMLQLATLLKDNSFEPQKQERGVYMPPHIHFKFIKKIFDYLGCAIFRKFSGIIAIESKKVLFSGVSSAVPKTMLYQEWSPQLKIRENMDLNK